MMNTKRQHNKKNKKVSCFSEFLRLALKEYPEAHDLHLRIKGRCKTQVSEYLSRGVEEVRLSGSELVRLMDETELLFVYETAKKLERREALLEYWQDRITRE